MKLFYSLLLIGLAGIATGAADDDSSVDAVSQRRALSKYRDFLRWVQQKEKAEVPNEAAIKKLKIEREADDAIREAGREKWIEERKLRQQKMSEEELDQKFEEIRLKSEEEQNRKEKAFIEKRDRINKAISKIPQVDPHDEYGVGHNYEDLDSDVDDE